MNIVNLTPHEVVLLDESHEIAVRVPSSGVASVAPVSDPLPAVELASGKIPASRVGFGTITGLPAPEPGTIYFVSAIVAGRAGRNDVASPGQCPVGGHKGCPACRHEDGRVKACHGIAFPS